MLNKIYSVIFKLYQSHLQLNCYTTVHQCMYQFISVQLLIQILWKQATKLLFKMTAILIYLLGEFENTVLNFGDIYTNSQESIYEMLHTFWLDILI